MNRKLKITLYIAGIFAAGVVTGLFISFMAIRHMMPSREKMANRWCSDLESKLNLTPEQLQKVRPLVDAALTNFRNNVSQDMLSSLSNCNARIVLELKPEQKAKFEQIEKEQKEFIRTKIGGEKPETAKEP
jgi:type I site-specific restriction endonuclease